MYSESKTGVRAISTIQKKRQNSQANCYVLLLLGADLAFKYYLIEQAFAWFHKPRNCVYECLSLSVYAYVHTCMCVCAFVCSYVHCVCSPPKLLITSDMVWCDMDPMQLVKQVLQLLYGSYSQYC